MSETPTPELAPTPEPLDLAAGLKDALKTVDSLFGIEKMMRDEGEDRTRVYYEQSRIGYEKFYSQRGCMHLAINTDHVYHPSGFRAQAVMVKRKIVNRGAKRVLELGAGMGFNVLHLAEQLPEVEFVALDLMPSHVAAIRARAAELGLTNVTVVEASYEPIPAELGTFDVVFGVETLCYAVDLDVVAGAIARVLAPGGWFVMFDPLRAPPLEDFSPEMQRAVKLYEISTAVNNGFSNAPAWEAALKGAGMVVESCVDRSLEVLPCLWDLHNRTQPFVSDWKAKLAIKAVPYLARNAVAGILGPYVYAHFDLPAGRETGPLIYGRLSAYKPEKTGR